MRPFPDLRFVTVLRTPSHRAFSAAVVGARAKCVAASASGDPVLIARAAHGLSMAAYGRVCLLPAEQKGFPPKKIFLQPGR